ncbi:hypothetical protein [Bifidobacterium sp. SO1]|uniref:hypothetical protein n=1 Tax=Bifidobacterium sp. SO1 TaxID=2809029 RepID=UPI001BDCB17E|nr:hypothetical protein [Bifidobacterium sp. SO1]MBT1161818.1 hypothetical protein [Bifidobacterium sp. SO1]
MLYVTCVGPGDMFGLRVRTDRDPDGMLIASALHPGGRRLVGGIILSAPPVRGMSAEDAARVSMDRIRFTWRDESGFRRGRTFRLGDIDRERGIPLDDRGSPMIPS